MLELRGGTHYLVLYREHSSASVEHRVAVYPRFRQVLDTWRPGARVSPIFALSGASLPVLAETPWILFCGPAYPGLLGEPLGAHSFLTLGVFNLVAFFPSREPAKSALLGLQHEVLAQERREPPWELWQLQAEHVTAVEFGGSSSSAIPPSLLSAIPGVVEPLEATAREYALLAATAVGRATPYLPSIADEVEQFDAAFRQVVGAENDLGRERLFVLANAALSRQTSQALAGTSPILETECHYWPHSLLGIGTASAALASVVRFVERTIHDARLDTRLSLLANVPPYRQGILLEQLESTDHFWDRDHLFGYPEQQALAWGSNPDDYQPMVTCFSGRDGFRSTRISLSAPLESISGANSQSWTLRTLTHELAHLMVDGILAVVLPDFSKQTDLNSLSLILSAPSVARSEFEQIRAFLVYAMWRLGGSNEEKKDVGEIIFLQKHRAVEFLAHALDYLYFYQSDPTAYVQSIWASWGAIPNIGNRVGRYVLRTLGALATEHLAREDGFAVAVEQAANQLVKVADSNPDLPYVGDAARLLQDNLEEARRHLFRCGPLLRLARYFFFSPRIAERFVKDILSGAGSQHEGYSLVPGTFQHERITNPLLFVNAYSGDTKGDHLRSAWILHQVASARPV